jgi:hypothetical protein
MSEAEAIDLVRSSIFLSVMKRLVTGYNWKSHVQTIYRRAVSIISRNQHAYVEITQFLRGAGMKVIDGDAGALDCRNALSTALMSNVTVHSGGAGNSIEDLVGIVDTYNVEEAYTVHSPSAYFCELLDALPRSAREHLFFRRPDLQYVELTDANTFTTLPY